MARRDSRVETPLKTMSPSRTARASNRSVRAREDVIPASSSGASASWSGVGKRRLSGAWAVGSGESPLSSGFPHRWAIRPAIVVAAFTEICWPRIARTVISKASHAPGVRMPACAAAARRRENVARQLLSDDRRIGAEIEHPPDALDDRQQRADRRCKHRASTPSLVSGPIAIVPTVSPIAIVRWYRLASTVSILGVARAARSQLPAASRRAAGGTGGSDTRRSRPIACASLRSSVGVRENVLRISPFADVAPNPAANAICEIGSRVSSISFLAKWTRRVQCDFEGVAPRCWTNSRRRWRAVTPRRSASASTPSRSSAPSLIRRNPRDTTLDVPAQAGVAGDASGRHRRQGRKPSACAAAAVR